MLTELHKYEISQFEGGGKSESFREEVGLKLEGQIKRKWKNVVIILLFATFTTWRLFFERMVLTELRLLKN